jgi:2-methylcitrate synthase
LHADSLDKSLILYAEHEFNASTSPPRVIAGTGSDLHSCITGAIGRCVVPKHGGANEVAMDIISRYSTPTRRKPTSAHAWSARKSSSASGHPVYTDRRPAQSDHQGTLAQAVQGRRQPDAVRRVASASRT